MMDGADSLSVILQDVPAISQPALLDIEHALNLLRRSIYGQATVGT